jgi:hypothetical protein
MGLRFRLTSATPRLLTTSIITATWALTTLVTPVQEPTMEAETSVEATSAEGTTALRYRAHSGG